MVKIEPRLQQRSWPRKLGVVWKTGNRDERFRGSNPFTSAQLIKNQWIMYTKQQILQFLENKGWSEIIDSRWESKVKSEILQEFPDIDNELLNYILNLVLI